MRTALLAATLAAVLACSPASAAEKRAIHDRSAVSVGALAAKSAAVVLARAVLRTDAEDATVFVLAVGSCLKGEAPPEIRVSTHAGAALCEGEHVAFLDRGPDGSWSLRGGPGFGWVHLGERTRELILQTVAAHAAGDLKAMARAASDALAGADPRLAGDAAVDLFNSPGMAGLLELGARKKIADLVGTPSGRSFIPGEWHYLAVTAGRLGDRASVAALVSAARDPGCLPRAFALGKAFSFVGDEGRAALLESFEAEKDDSALPGFMAVCAEVRLAQALPKVLRIADSGGAQARKFALVAAGDIGGPAAIEFLKAAMNDGARPLVERKLAVVALAANADRDGIRAIVEADEKNQDPELVKFVRAFRKDPASERLQLLRTALREE